MGDIQKTKSKPSGAGLIWKGGAMTLGRKNTGSYETCVFERSKISSDAGRNVIIGFSGQVRG